MYPLLIKRSIIAVIPAVAVFILRRKKFGLQDLSFKYGGKNILLKSLAICAGIGFYDGFFGPGTGTFFAISFTAFCGYDLLQATALSKVLNFSSNISALAAFLILGRLNLKLGLLMALVSVLGNLAGASFALKKGAIIIRPLLAIMTGALLLKIILDMVK